PRVRKLKKWTREFQKPKRMAYGKCRLYGNPQKARIPTETWKSLAKSNETFPHFPQALLVFLFLMSRQKHPVAKAP
ncbi:MAG: hypothetical protein LAP85_29770, partial [Acidobacteriia bacterium]|nr:hypothetical protein [Terriglobia bacterium]